MAGLFWLAVNGHAQPPEPPAPRTIPERSFRPNPALGPSTNASVAHPPSPYESPAIPTNHVLGTPVPPPQPPGLRTIPTRTLQLAPIPSFTNHLSVPGVPPPLPQRSSPEGEQKLRVRQKELMRNYTNAFAQAVHKNPRTALANAPDMREMAFSNSILRWESMLADTNLSPSVRQAYQKSLESDQQRLRDVQADAALWRDVHNAREAGDKPKLAEAEQKLANHMVEKLAARDGKTYPTNLTLKEVTELYKASIGERKKAKEENR